MTERAYKQMCLKRNAAFKKKFGRPMNYEDVLKSFGGRMTGESQVDCNFRGNRISQDDGVKDQS